MESYSHQKLSLLEEIYNIRERGILIISSQNSTFLND
jgi:hypothetical protein